MPDDSNALMASPAAKILGGKGAKLHAEGMHIRRTANKGFIAKHELRDKKGNPPMDGQRGEAEYSLADKAALLKHIEEHMQDEPDEEEQASE